MAENEEVVIVTGGAKESGGSTRSRSPQRDTAWSWQTSPTQVRR